MILKYNKAKSDFYYYVRGVANLVLEYLRIFGRFLFCLFYEIAESQNLRIRAENVHVLKI